MPSVRETGTFREDWPINFAHRGTSARAPENTLEAFRMAVEAGAGGLELDVHMTRDGEIVVIHDSTVDRTTDGSGAVAEMTLDNLRTLDVGYRFSPGGARIPTAAGACGCRRSPKSTKRFRIPT